MSKISSASTNSFDSVSSISKTEIINNSKVVLHFTIRLANGSVADSTYNMGKPAQLSIGDGSLSENFESHLLGLSAGDKKSVDLKAEDAFGAPNPDNIHHMDRSKFVGDAAVEVGTIMAFSGPDGVEIPGIISDITGDSVTVDFNHPLAGQDVTFEVEILSVE
ncbi:FKBP-type peptidyl-prolyl cis-trans isomerase [Vibrio sp. TH_r3]|uniref:FKBP-type peptidyl-prolyl cis-trans isomerase n=1 Tax=Vibrio sp. TH_r3 TaxID=3082084 RepID=UPI0029554D04|nr:FKBP-type peptidyl-prolyl cis-trans isomerase [Vibrio sp. TH_r3]MDV7104423.1 FKBP-type peptidyl-prolyl cis-trans isomerase [Vibrio sp. TH_r3]